jgi:hypothetical protein
MRDTAILLCEQASTNLAVLCGAAVHAATIAAANRLMSLVVWHANGIVASTSALFVVHERTLDALGQCARDLLTTTPPVEFIRLPAFANIDDLRRGENSSGFGFRIMQQVWQRWIRVHKVKISHLGGARCFNFRRRVENSQAIG